MLVAKLCIEDILNLPVVQDERVYRVSLEHSGGAQSAQGERVKS